MVHCQEAHHNRAGKITQQKLMRMRIPHRSACHQPVQVTHANACQVNKPSQPKTAQRRGQREAMKTVLHEWLTQSNPNSRRKHQGCCLRLDFTMHAVLPGITDAQKNPQTGNHRDQDGCSRNLQLISIGRIALIISHITELSTPPHAAQRQAPHVAKPHQCPPAYARG